VDSGDSGSGTSVGLSSGADGFWSTGGGTKGTNREETSWSTCSVRPSVGSVASEGTFSKGFSGFEGVGSKGGCAILSTTGSES